MFGRSPSEMIERDAALSCDPRIPLLSWSAYVTAHVRAMYLNGGAITVGLGHLLATVPCDVRGPPKGRVGNEGP